QPPKPVKEVVKPEPKKPEPRPEPKHEPRKPEPKPEPKKPEPKPEPKKPEPKPEPRKPDPRETAKAEAQARAEQARLDKLKADKEAKDAKIAAERSRALEERRMRELMARDSENAKQSGEIQKELARIANEKAKASNSRALKAYTDKIAAKVRGNIILPPGVSGDPVGVFYVDQLPDGSVIEVRLKRSTGNAQLDAAIERAIQKSSPLPKPDRSELFQRTLNFEFYPLRD
ncbi:MAG: TonB C-terminal domain-containing protein, partial [Zoogloea sp.]|nr:TonB C-terminal domain-containing protein [Zoogloea sp.]